MGVSNFKLVIRLFEKSKIFYPPEGLCGAEPEGGPIVFTFNFIGVGKGTGVSQSEYSIGLFETSKMFYLPEGLCGAEPEGGPIVFTYALLV